MSLHQCCPNFFELRYAIRDFFRDTQFGLENLRQNNHPGVVRGSLCVKNWILRTKTTNTLKFFQKFFKFFIWNPFPKIPSYVPGIIQKFFTKAKVNLKGLPLTLPLQRQFKGKGNFFLPRQMQSFLPLQSHCLC